MGSRGDLVQEMRRRLIRLIISKSSREQPKDPTI